MAVTKKAPSPNRAETTPTAPKALPRINRQSRLFKAIIKAIIDKKGEEVISLDLRKVNESIADYFIICQASTNTQVKAIGDFIQDQVKELVGEFPYKTEGYQQGKWVLIDYVNVVVHIMQPEPRGFYRLEELWSDGDLVKHEA